MLGMIKRSVAELEAELMPELVQLKLFESWSQSQN